MSFKLSEIPSWAHGEIYNFLKENQRENDKDIIFEKKLFFDLNVKSLRDVLNIIDTCAYFGTEKIPTEIYNFAIANKQLLSEMNKDFISKEDYIIREEYKSIFLCTLLHESTRVLPNYHKAELINSAIRNNNMALIKYVVEDLEYCDVIQAIDRAVIYDNIEMIKYILKKYPDMIDEIRNIKSLCTFSIEKQNVKLLKFLVETVGVYLEDYILNIAIIHDKDCAEYILRNTTLKIKISYYTLKFAGKYRCQNDIFILILNYPYFNLEDKSMAFNYAISGGCNIEIIKYMYEVIGCRPNDQTIKLINQYCFCKDECISYLFENA